MRKRPRKSSARQGAHRAKQAIYGAPMTQKSKEKRKRESKRLKEERRRMLQNMPDVETDPYTFNVNQYNIKAMNSMDIGLMSDADLDREIKLRERKYNGFIGEIEEVEEAFSQEIQTDSPKHYSQEIDRVSIIDEISPVMNIEPIQEQKIFSKSSKETRKQWRDRQKQKQLNWREEQRRNPNPKSITTTVHNRDDTVSDGEFDIEDEFDIDDYSTIDPDRITTENRKKFDIDDYSTIDPDRITTENRKKKENLTQIQKSQIYSSKHTQNLKSFNVQDENSKYYVELQNWKEDRLSKFDNEIEFQQNRLEKFGSRVSYRRFLEKQISEKYNAVLSTSVYQDKELMDEFSGPIQHNKFSVDLENDKDSEYKKGGHSRLKRTMKNIEIYGVNTLNYETNIVPVMQSTSIISNSKNETNIVPVMQSTSIISNSKSGKLNNEVDPVFEKIRLQMESLQNDLQNKSTKNSQKIDANKSISNQKMKLLEKDKAVIKIQLLCRQKIAKHKLRVLKQQRDVEKSKRIAEVQAQAIADQASDYLNRVRAMDNFAAASMQAVVRGWRARNFVHKKRQEVYALRQKENENHFSGIEKALDEALADLTTLRKKAKHAAKIAKTAMYESATLSETAARARKHALVAERKDSIKANMKAHKLEQDAKNSSKLLEKKMQIKDNFEEQVKLAEAKLLSIEAANAMEVSERSMSITLNHKDVNKEYLKYSKEMYDTETKSAVILQAFARGRIIRMKMSKQSNQTLVANEGIVVTDVSVSRNACSPSENTLQKIKATVKINPQNYEEKKSKLKSNLDKIKLKQDEDMKVLRDKINKKLQLQENYTNTNNNTNYNTNNNNNRYKPDKLFDEVLEKHSETMRLDPAFLEIEKPPQSDVKSIQPSHIIDDKESNEKMNLQEPLAVRHNPNNIENTEMPINNAEREGKLLNILRRERIGPPTLIERRLQRQLEQNSKPWQQKPKQKTQSIPNVSLVHKRKKHKRLIKSKTTANIDNDKSSLSLLLSGSHERSDSRVSQIHANAVVKATLEADIDAHTEALALDLRHFLKSCQLEIYENKLLQEGVTETDDVTTLDEEQLIELANTVKMKPIEIKRLCRRVLAIQNLNYKREDTGGNQIANNNETEEEDMMRDDRERNAFYAKYSKQLQDWQASCLLKWDTIKEYREKREGEYNSRESYSQYLAGQIAEKLATTVATMERNVPHFGISEVNTQINTNLMNPSKNSKQKKSSMNNAEVRALKKKLLQAELKVARQAVKARKARLTEGLTMRAKKKKHKPERKKERRNNRVMIESDRSHRLKELQERIKLNVQERMEREKENEKKKSLAESRSRERKLQLRLERQAEEAKRRAIAEEIIEKKEREREEAFRRRREFQLNALRMKEQQERELYTLRERSRFRKEHKLLPHALNIDEDRLSNSNNDGAITLAAEASAKRMLSPRASKRIQKPNDINHLNDKKYIELAERREGRREKSEKFLRHIQNISTGYVETKSPNSIGVQAPKERDQKKHKRTESFNTDEIIARRAAAVSEANNRSRKAAKSAKEMRLSMIQQAQGDAVLLAPYDPFAHPTRVRWMKSHIANKARHARIPHIDDVEDVVNPMFSKNDYGSALSPKTISSPVGKPDIQKTLQEFEVERRSRIEKAEIYREKKRQIGKTKAGRRLSALLEKADKSIDAIQPISLLPENWVKVDDNKISKEPLKEQLKEPLKESLTQTWMKPAARAAAKRRHRLK